jgi:hypothetical protein
MSATSRQHKIRRTRVLLVVAGGVLIVAAFAAFVLLRHGVDGVVHFFTTPTIEADSGKKYTPVTGLKRVIEKFDE